MSDNRVDGAGGAISRWRFGLAVILSPLLFSCGGGGGDGSGGGAIGGSGWTAGVYQPYSSFAAKCASPRSGSSTVTGQPFPDAQGAALDERNWLRSWTHELYLWYGEVPDLNPASYTTPNYFKQLKTTVAGKDKFHFTYSTAEWEALSIAGQEFGYGVQWHVIPATATTAPRVRVAYLEPGANSAAALAGLVRGDEVESVDGVNLTAVVTQSQADTVNEGIFPSSAGTHTFGIRRLNGTTYSAALSASAVTASPVMNVSTIDSGAGLVGYIQFNNHLYPSEAALFNAIVTLKAANSGAGIVDLVLDIRYNGGGLLDVASELAYMIAGPAMTAGQTFERLTFNDKHPSTDPVTGNPIVPTLFHNITQGFSLTPGAALPTLNLNRVFVLTGDETCSASESIINGLRGVDVEVIQIGSTTCGKPYGFYPADNCGTTYFSIQFQGVNAKGFGDYSNGFSPNNTVSNAGERIAGCSIADDFSHALGNPAEGRLAAALSYRMNPSCPAPTGIAPNNKIQSAQTVSAAAMTIRRPFWRENRILIP